MNTFTHLSGKYIETESAKIYYEEIGNNTKSVLLFLHGGLQHIEDFNAITSYFTDDHRIIGIDTRAHGKSSLGKVKLTYEQLEHDVEVVINHLKLNNFSILGFSDGGIIAYRLASKNKLKIDKLISIGATWHTKDALSTKEILLKVTPEFWKEKFPESYSLYQKINPEPDFDQFVKSVVEMWLDEGKTGYPNENVSLINCPTLVVRGDNDHLFSLESVAEVTGKIKNSTLLNIPFAGHMVYADQPEIFVKIVKQFLKE